MAMLDENLGMNIPILSEEKLRNIAMRFLSTASCYENGYAYIHGKDISAEFCILAIHCCYAYFVIDGIYVLHNKSMFYS